MSTTTDITIAQFFGGVTALTSALNRNSDTLDRVIAGQEAAMEALKSGGGATRTTRAPRQSAAEKAAAAGTDAGTNTTPSTTTPAAGEEPVAESSAGTHALLTSPNSETAPLKNPKTGVEEDTPTANYRAADFSRDQVKNEFIGWLGETDDVEERKSRAAFVGAIGQNFGVKLPFALDENGNPLLDAEQFKQALFFLRRKREGLAVDFSAEYDFDGDPLADQTTDEAPAEDEIEDALG